jgi:hypothetical protein
MAKNVYEMLESIKTEINNGLPIKDGEKGIGVGLFNDSKERVFKTIDDLRSQLKLIHWVLLALIAAALIMGGFASVLKINGQSTCQVACMQYGHAEGYSDSALGQCVCIGVNATCQAPQPNYAFTHLPIGGNQG